MAAVVAPVGGFTVVTHTYPQHVQYATSGIAPTGEHHKFLKGKPTALGTVQIMIGVVVLMFSVVTAFYGINPSVSGVMFWGAILYIVAGGLTVGASKSLNLCLVRASMVMNIFSTITAGIAIITHSTDIIVISNVFRYECYDSDYRYTYNNCQRNQSREQGIAGVMLVLSVLEFIVSICVSTFACKATCCTNTEQVRYISSQAYSSIPTTHQAAASLNPQVMYLPNLPNQVPPSCPSPHLSATPLTTSEIPDFPPTEEPPAYSNC